MKIGIIGSGKMGLGVGKMWAIKGHKILFADILADAAVGAAASVKDASYGTVEDAANFGDAVLLSIPYSSLNDVLKQISSSGIKDKKIIIDCINPISSDYRSLLVGHNTSVAEEISGALASEAGNFKVVKTLNTIASPVFETGDTSFGDEKATMFYCGDDDTAKRIAYQLLEDLGFEPIDVGALVNARYLEPLAALVIQLAMNQNMGTNIALKLLKR